MNKSTNIELISLDTKGAVYLDNGMMKVPATLTRVGVFNYVTADGSVRKELRTAEEVFDKESMDSFEMVPLTNDHPYAEGGTVTAENAKRLTVGTVGNIRRNGNRLDAMVMISDAATIADVKSGKVQLSCGYMNAREEKSGVYTDESGNQQTYTHVQHKIRGNHVALVQVGRAGPEARLRLDSQDAAVLVTDETVQTEKEQPMKTITLDSIPVEMSEASAAIVNKVIADRDAKITAQEAGIAAAAIALKEANAKTDKLQASLDSANADLKAATDPAKFTAAVTARVGLESSARKILGADAELSKMTVRDIKTAVVKKLSPSLTCDGKTDDYVEGLYESACAKVQNGNAATEVVKAQIAAGQAKVIETTTDSVDDPFKKMMEEHNTSKPWKPAQAK